MGAADGNAPPARDPSNGMARNQAPSPDDSSAERADEYATLAAVGAIRPPPLPERMGA